MVFDIKMRVFKGVWRSFLMVIDIKMTIYKPIFDGI